jgi:hypothetical protein
MVLRIGLLCIVLSAVVSAQRSGAPSAPASGAGGGTPAAAASGTAGGAAGGQGAGAGRDQSSDILIKALEVQKWYLQLGDIAEVN